jgi:hypothetical protein
MRRSAIRKLADFRAFQPLRTSRSRAFLIDNGSRERHALAALGLAAERPIGLAGRRRSGARRFANLSFANGIADAYDHE